MASRDRRAIATIGAAACLDTAGAFGFAASQHVSVGTGFYWSVTTATTVGYGDVVPHDTVGKLIAVGVMLTVIPLFAATFSLLTSGLTAVHVRRHVREEVGDLHARVNHLIDNIEGVPPYVAPVVASVSEVDIADLS